MKVFEHQASVWRRVPVGRKLLVAVSVVVAACGGEPTAPPPPTTGSISATISGLPAGFPAAVNVSGPNGYHRGLAASDTLGELVPGTYHISATNVQDGPHQYQASSTTQTITVAASATPASVAIDYALTTGGLALTLIGIPAGGSGDVLIVGPGLTQTVSASQTFTGMTAGSYTVTASSVIIGSTAYDASPASQVVAVMASRTPATATVTYAGAGAAPFNLTIDHAYMVQATQRYAKSGSNVALVEGRDAVLRVFVTASVSNGATPDVRVRLYRGGALIDTQVLAAAGASVPTSPGEGSLSDSWNLLVPAALIRSDLSYLVDVDPSNAIVEDDEADNTFPADGTPLGVTVVAVPPLAVRLIPVYHDSTGRTGDLHHLGATAPVRQWQQRLGPDLERDQATASGRRQLALLLRCGESGLFLWNSRPGIPYRIAFQYQQGLDWLGPDQQQGLGHGPRGGTQPWPEAFAGMRRRRP